MSSEVKSLVLSRRVGQKLIFEVAGERFEVVLAKQSKSRSVLVIKAGRNVVVHREEAIDQTPSSGVACIGPNAQRRSRMAIPE